MAQPVDSAYVAALWEYPQLCIAFFGVQFLTPEGRALYEAAGLSGAVPDELLRAHPDGLLLNRPTVGAEGPVLLQYWRSYDDLERWSRHLPHTEWWRWLVANAGNGVGFFHEIYQVGAGEAIYEKGTLPVGPAAFCTRLTVPTGQGRSRQRMKRFAEAHQQS
jgi:hypothetical protein